MDNFFTRALKKNPKPYTIIGLGVGVLAISAITGIMDSLLGAVLRGFLVGMGLSAISYWNND